MYICINIHALFNLINRLNVKNLANSISKFMRRKFHVYNSHTSRVLLNMQVRNLTSTFTHLKS